MAEPTTLPAGALTPDRRLGRLVRWDVLVAGLLLVVLLYGFVGVDNFGSTLNLSFLLGNTMAIALVALPMTMLVVAGEVDLSVGSMAGLSSALMGVDTIVYGNDDAQTSFQATQGLLQSYPNLKGIISPTTVGIKAAAQYLDGSQYKGKVQLVGLGTPNDMRQYVKDGMVTAFELWDPGKLGELAAYAAAGLASGIISGAQGQTFTAGDLGKYTIGADGEILLGDPTVFNKDNIDQFHF